MTEKQNKFQIIDSDINNSQKIWRFMSIGKFMNLIFSKKLFFTPPSLFEDISEGARTDSMYENLIQKLEKIPDRKRGMEQILNEQPEDYLQINCWYYNDCESIALWKLYTSKEGICIQSTVSKLMNSLNCDKLEDYEKFYIGKVRYRT